MAQYQVMENATEIISTKPLDGSLYIEKGGFRKRTFRAHIKEAEDGFHVIISELTPVKDKECKDWPDRIVFDFVRDKGGRWYMTNSTWGDHDVQRYRRTDDIIAVIEKLRGRSCIQDFLLKRHGEAISELLDACTKNKAIRRSPWEALKP